jgi:hypothetical protein
MKNQEMPTQGLPELARTVSVLEALAAVKELGGFLPPPPPERRPCVTRSLS